MKKMITTIFFMTLVSVSSAQTFEEDLMTMLELNGSSKTYDFIYSQMVIQIKAQNANIPESAWPKVKEDIFDEYVKKLNKKLVPIYQKQFTQNDIQKINAFYRSETGKKLAEKTPIITQNSMQISQMWGMELGLAIQSYLDGQVYEKDANTIDTN